MSFRWHHHGTFDQAAIDAEGLNPEFVDQVDAEEWLTDNFDFLLEHGVESVTLYDGEEKIYRMALGE